VRRATQSRLIVTTDAPPTRSAVLHRRQDSTIYSTGINEMSSIKS